MYGGGVVLVRLGCRHGRAESGCWEGFLFGSCWLISHPMMCWNVVHFYLASPESRGV